MYKIIYSPKAIEDLQKLKRSEPAAYKKADKFIKELKEHPKTGTGHPEPLKGDRNGQWSRTITKKHRLIYEIFETEVYVDVLSSWGHYNDKQVTYTPTGVIHINNKGGPIGPPFVVILNVPFYYLEHKDTKTQSIISMQL